MDFCSILDKNHKFSLKNEHDNTLKTNVFHEFSYLLFIFSSQAGLDDFSLTSTFWYSNKFNRVGSNVNVTIIVQGFCLLVLIISNGICLTKQFY